MRLAGPWTKIKIPQPATVRRAPAAGNSRDVELSQRLQKPKRVGFFIVFHDASHGGKIMERTATNTPRTPF
jgi:hypothetical protein